MNYPVPEHETWYIYDSTKVQDYLDCPRSYFFKYVLGWRPIEPNVHLEFGQAWHLAMEHLLCFGYSNKSCLDAYAKLAKYYRKFFSEETDALRYPKVPGNALAAIAQYVSAYKNDAFNVLYTEIAGTVPITEEDVIHFRMDSIMENQDGLVQSLEHKTGSQLSRQWRDQWAQSVQTGTYNHVLYCLFPPEKVYGTVINGTIFNKKQIQFERVPARRPREMMNDWYWSMIQYVAEIKWDMERLKKCSPKDNVLMCFRKNPQSCTKYFGCEFHDFCCAWPNPLAKCDQAPFDYQIVYWNPADKEGIKQTFDFSKQMVKEVIG